MGKWKIELEVDSLEMAQTVVSRVMMVVVPNEIEVHITRESEE